MRPPRRSAPPPSDLRLTLAHLYFSRQQDQLALDTAVVYFCDLEQRLGRKPMEVQRFVDKLTQLGLTPTVQSPQAARAGRWRAKLRAPTSAGR